MSYACPNKNSKEWKMLVSQVGEDLANRAFFANDYKMPDVKSTTDIKKAIGHKTQMINTTGMQVKLRKFNQQNGTSHSFVTKKLWGNTVEVTMKYNYLPINLANQIQRDNNRKEPGSAMDLSDDLIPTAPNRVSEVEKITRNKLHKEVVQAKDTLKKAKTKEDIIKSQINLAELKVALDVIDGRVIQSQNIDSFDDVLSFGKRQLAEVKELLKSPAISADNLIYANRIINLWTKAGDFSTEPTEHIILDEYEFQTPEIRSAFRELAATAEDQKSLLIQFQRAQVTNFVQQYTSGKLTADEIYAHLADVNKVASETLNLGRLGDPMMEGLFNAVEQANILAQQEANEVFKSLDDLGQKFLKKTGNSYDILKQRTSDGLETGRLVHRFSNEFFLTRQSLMASAFYRKDATTGAPKKDPALIKQYFDWVNKNTVSFDPRMLFEDSLDDETDIPERFAYTRVKFTAEDKAKHIADLKNQLGEKGYTKYLERAEKKIESFKEVREAIYTKIQNNDNLSQDEKDAEFYNWIRENSPYWAVDMNENPSMRVRNDKTFYKPQGQFVIQVPRRVLDNKETGWYDKNYSKIEADSDLEAFHDYLLSTLNQLKYVLPEHKQKLLGVNVLPTIEKSLMDIFSDKGMMMGITPFWNKFKSLQTTTDFSRTVNADVDPLTGEVARSVQLQYIADNEPRIKNIISEKTIAYRQQTGQEPTAVERKKFRQEAMDTISKEKSWDLVKIMKAYSMTVLAYKHKSIIEPQVKLIEQAFRERQEIITNKADQPLTREGKVQTKEGLSNLKGAMDFFLDSTFYGYGARKVQGVTETKIYTKEEKARKAELEALLANETNDKNKEFLQQQIDALGGFRTLSGTGDAVLKLMTLKGLGWNFASAFSNIGFGTISNLIEGSGGLNYSAKNLRKAYMLTLNSVGRNLSADILFNDPNGTATKIRSLMDDWDILKTSTEEMFDMSQKSSLNKLKRFGPFTLQQRSEYLNQAPILIATLMESKAKDPQGNVVSLWEAFGPNSELKEGYTTDEDIPKTIQKIRRIIEMNHGDYTNALKVKESIQGRAFTQFRTWMFEGFATRFEKEKADYTLGDGADTYIRKGRYRSYTKGQLTSAGAAIGTMALPGIGTAVGAGLGYLGGKFFGMQSGDNALADTMFSLKQLARKLMFQSTQFDTKFNKTDAANMRRNMTELTILLGLMGVALLLKASLEDDDDEDQMVTNFLLNQTIRLRTDIGFYSNPLEFEKLTKTALPMASLIQDAKKLTTDVMHLFNDQKDDDVFESGPFKGVPKAYIHSGELIPGSAQAIKLYRMGQTVFDK